LKGSKPPQIISESQNNKIVQDLSSDSKDDDSTSVGSQWNNADGADERTSSLIQMLPRMVPLMIMPVVELNMK
jgi:hypothetical protein